MDSVIVPGEGMLDFEREDELLKTWVGADARRIITAASVSWADRFYLARERMAELAAEKAASEAVVLERDRLASYFGCAYGRNGLLARAGALLSLRERLQRVATLAPRLIEDASGMGRMRREALILRTFARERLMRGRPQPVDAALFEVIAAATQSTLACADFVAAASAVDHDLGGFKGARGLWAAADLGVLAASAPPARPFVALVAFALARAGDGLAQRAASMPAYDALIEANYAALRRQMWEANEALYAEQSEPASIAEIEKADLALETLLCHLTDRRAPSAARARMLAEIWALIAAGRSGHAARKAAVALDGALLLLAEGLAVEAKGLQG